MVRVRVKDQQKSQVYEYICAETGVSRKQIASVTGVRPIDVTRHVAELLEDELVVEAEPETSRKRGRPEKLLTARYDSMGAVAVTVVSRQIVGSVVDMDGRSRSKTGVYLPEGASGRSIRRNIEKIVGDLVRSPVRPNYLKGVGFSLSGQVDPVENVWRRTTRWPNVNDFELEPIGDAFGLAVRADQNSIAKLRYLIHVNRDLSRGNVLFVQWGWAVKLAFAHEGTLVRSLNGRFGEIGHWTVNAQSPRLCSCGRHGCLETETALWYLIHDIRKKYPGVPAGEEEFSDFFRMIPYASVAHVIDPAVEQMATALVNLYLAFSPDTVFVCGPFTDNDEVFARLIEETHRRDLHRSQSIEIQRLATQFGGENLGVTQSFFRRATDELLLSRW